MPLQLIAVLASFYCLRLPKPTQTVQSTEPGWPCMQQLVTTTCCASSIPATIPARAPASPQLKHEPNSPVKPACVFLDNSFLHNPDLRHLFSAAVQLTGRTCAEVLEEQNFPWPLTGALVTRCLRRGSAVIALAGACARHVPSGPSPEVPSRLNFKELNCSSSRAGAWHVFPYRFSKELLGRIILPQLGDAYVRACHLQSLFLWSTERNRHLKGMVHFFLLTIKAVHDDEPSCKRLHSIKLREMNSVPVPKIFGGSKHLTPLLNIQKLFHIF